MPEIALKNSDKVVLVDEDDVERCSNHSWWLNRTGYVYTQINKKHIQMHRFIMKMKKSKPHLDHINGNKLDNRKENLRPATIKENVWNRGPQRTCKSGYRGVVQCTTTGNWRASIMADGYRHYLGGYNSAEDAAKAWDLKAIELYGEFAWLNFPDFDYSNYEPNPRTITSRFAGVHWCKLHKDWVGCIYINKKRHHVGRFKTELEAAKAVRKHIEKHCPERLKRRRYSSLPKSN